MAAEETKEIKTETVEFNGKKYTYRVYDYDTPEGWHEWVNDTFGSIDDETFVRPVDFYEDFYNKHKDEILSR